MTRTTAYRIITNSRPHDYRSGIEPMAEPSPWRVHWRGIVGAAALLAMGLALWSITS